MISLESIAMLLTTNSTDDIFYNPTNEDIITISQKTTNEYLKNSDSDKFNKDDLEKIEIINQSVTNYVRVPRLTKRAYRVLIDEFVDLNRHFLFGLEKVSILKIKKRLLSDQKFEKAWISFLADAIASHYIDFYETYNLKEDEASPETYKRLVALLKKYEKAHYEKTFASSHMFTFECYYTFGTKAICSVLGNSGIVRGVSIYYDKNCELVHELISTDCDNYDKCYHSTLVELSKQITFYFNDVKKDDHDIYGEENPYTKDDSITSFTSYYGTTYHCYLTNSAAHIAIRQLNHLIKALEAISKDASFLDLDASHEFIVFDNEYTHYLQYPIFQRHELLTNLPFPLVPVEITNIKSKMKLLPNEAWEFAARFIPGLYLCDDDKICQWNFIMCFIDHYSGKIIKMDACRSNLYDPFTGLNEKLLDLFTKEGVAKTIYCGTNFDALLLAGVLALDKKIASKIDVVFSKDVYKHIDDIVDNLTEFMDKSADA